MKTHYLIPTAIATDVACMLEAYTGRPVKADIRMATLSSIELDLDPILYDIVDEFIGGLLIIAGKMAHVACAEITRNASAG